MEVRTILQHFSPAFFFLPRLNFSLSFSKSSSQVVQGYGEYGLWSAHHALSLTLLLPYVHPLLWLGVPPTGENPSRNSPLWVLPTGFSSSQTPPAWVFSMGCNVSKTDCSSLGALLGRWSCQKTCFCMGFSPQGYRSCQVTALVWASLHGLQFPSGYVCLM